MGLCMCVPMNLGVEPKKPKEGWTPGKATSLFLACKVARGASGHPEREGVYRCGDCHCP